MLLNANNRQRYCVRVSINVSLSLKHAMWAWLVFATSGAWFNGCDFMGLSGRGLIHGSQMLMLIFGHLFVILRVYYMLLVLMLFLFPKICVKF